MASKRKSPKSYKELYKDLVPNNPKYDRSIVDSDAKAEQEVKDTMLYDSKTSIDEKKRLDIVKRMLSAYKKRKREKKIDKLLGNDKHWQGLS